MGLVTTRLRTASSTWVRAAVCAILVGCAEILIIGSDLLTWQEGVTNDLLARILLIVVAFLGVCVLGVPLARVAEVFEYDVLRALNTPLVVKHAQRHFGQQLLAHLHTLEWG